MIVNKLFNDQLGKRIKVYIDNIITKSLKINDHISDLWATFKVLRANQIKMNLKNVPLVYPWGSYWVIWLGSLALRQNLGHLIQNLTGWVVILSYFISWATENANHSLNLSNKGRKLTGALNMKRTSNN